jgi:hypothetical protein
LGFDVRAFVSSRRVQDSKLDAWSWKLLLLPKRDQRIDFRCATRWNPRRERRHGREQNT